MLDERERLVLQTIIKEYIEKSEPVGSRNVSKIGPLKMSSATIRNIMGDLEEKGYLHQPHTSAGRVPTDRAYRYYVDHLVSIDTQDAKFADMIHESMEFDSHNLPSMMQEFSKRLGVLTNSVGFVAANTHDVTYAKRIEFKRLNSSTLLAIIISKVGFVQNALIPVDSALTDSDVERIANYLNSQLDKTTINELLNNVKQDLASNTKQIHKIIATLAKVERELELQSIYMDGATNILSFPEFKDTDTLKYLLRTIDEKRNIMDILEKCMDNEGIQIFVGREIGLEIEELGLVTCNYSKDGSVLGMVGVIGPKRMEYEKMISVINYSSKILEKMIEQLHGGI